jgi:hypothetical protein
MIIFAIQLVSLTVFLDAKLCKFQSRMTVVAFGCLRDLHKLLVGYCELAPVSHGGALCDSI